MTTNSAGKQPVTQNDPLGHAAEWVHIDELDPWEKNPRKNDEAAPRLAKLIVKLGFGTPMLAWVGDGGRKQIIAGHTRKKAVQILQRKVRELKPQQRAKWHPDAIRTAETGMLPVRVRLDLTPAQARQLAIADNKANEFAEWDEGLLVEALSDFSLTDVEDLGFDPDKLDRLADDLYGLGGDLESSSKKIEDPGFSVIIECTDEAQQLEVIEWAQSQELKCRALI